MNVKDDDHVLVVTDAGKLRVGNVIALTSRATGAETVLIVMPLLEEHGNEPPSTVAAAMVAADVVFAPTTHAITHRRARRNAYASGARVMILRGVDEEMMICGAMAVNFARVKEITAKVAEILNQSRLIRVTTPAGTDVAFSVEGRCFIKLDGYFQDEMGFAALPGGECPTSPVEGSTNGVIVVDYSMDGLGRLSQPLVFAVKEGRAVSVQGSVDEQQAMERLFEKDESARNIAEFSVGTNPGARLVGNLAEDKKLLGTVHFAIGDSTSLGGTVEALIHLDGLLLRPTIVLDGKKVLIADGNLMM